MVKVQDVMTRCVRSVPPMATLAQAAELMTARDLGALLVLDGKRLVGIVTDRDLIVRGLAGGHQRTSPVYRVMTKPVVTCDADADLSDALRIMAEHQVRRIPICSREGELVGIVSLADAARNDEYGEEAAAALSAICRARGLHCQAETEVADAAP